MARAPAIEAAGNVACYTMRDSPARDGTYDNIESQWVSGRAVRGVETFALSSPTVEFTDTRTTRTIKRALFTFDFRSQNDGQPDQMEHVKRIRSAKITLNASAVTGVTKVYLAETTDMRGGLLTVESARTVSIKGGPPLLPIPRDPQIDRDMITGYVNINSTGLVTWELPESMKAGIHRALRNRTFYTIAVLDYRDLRQSTAGTLSRGAATSVITFSDFSSSSTAPKLDITYVLDNSRINQGGGLTRSSKSGFMENNMFSGTNSGLSS